VSNSSPGLGNLEGKGPPDPGCSDIARAVEKSIELGGEFQWGHSARQVVPRHGTSKHTRKFGGGPAKTRQKSPDEHPAFSSNARLKREKDKGLNFENEDTRERESVFSGCGGRRNYPLRNGVSRGAAAS